MGVTTRLRPLSPADEAEALRAHAELAEDGFDFLLGWHDQGWTAYVDELEAFRRGEVPDGMVPATFLVAVDEDGMLVGRVSVRHELNDFLARVGGHVGYGVRPGHRRRGHATALLRGGLDVLRAQGVDRALVTCDEDNAGSAAVIERCGGVPDGLVEQEGGPTKRRYWIDLVTRA